MRMYTAVVLQQIIHLNRKKPKFQNTHENYQMNFPKPLILTVSFP